MKRINNKEDKEYIYESAASIGAITHGHPMSHLSCQLMALIIHNIINSEASLKEIIINGVIDLSNYCCDYPNKYFPSFLSLINKAISINNNLPDEENIRSLGEGWVAEETIAIAIYCSIKYQDNPIKGIIASVNHNGDSDSTGSLTGQILGAYNGYSSFPKEYIDNLELHEVIEEVATDLSTKCPFHEFSPYSEEKRKWDDKYVLKK